MSSRTRSPHRAIKEFAALPVAPAALGYDLGHRGDVGVRVGAALVGLLGAAPGRSRELIEPAASAVRVAERLAGHRHQRYVEVRVETEAVVLQGVRGGGAPPLHRQHDIEVGRVVLRGEVGPAARG